MIQIKLHVTTPCVAGTAHKRRRGAERRLKFTEERHCDGAPPMSASFTSTLAEFPQICTVCTVTYAS